ncbi:MAG: LLM class flavin-dependent oxidoreductase [Deltaproteobacteria bacterium]|nr:LLM class flavin-dependent oxidoreductase [Deltaproteobacteria bacterium]
MKVGLCFDGFYSMQEMVELARLADDVGMDSIWMSDHICFRDCLASSMAFLATTRRITVIPAPLSPYSRHPIICAMAIATLEEFAPGRVGATAGTGNAAALEEVGIKATRPLKTMREYMEILRRFLSGETVQFQGEVFHIRGAKMGFQPTTPVPIFMTAVKPRMLRLAGEIGDGVLLSAGCAPEYIDLCAKEIRKGLERAKKSPEESVVAGFVTTSVSENAAEAIEASKTFLAYIFRNKHHAENIRMGGGKIDQESLAAAVARRDWEGAKKLVSDEVVFAHSVSGTASECRRRLENFIQGGLSLPILLPMGNQEARKKVVEMARTLSA